jgi:outer membrane lipoprotein-sorting protein
LPESIFSGSGSAGVSEMLEFHVLPIWLLALMLAYTPAHGSPSDVLADAIAHYRDIGAYRVTVHSVHQDGEESMRHYFKKPGFVRMEFIEPHRGAVLIFSPLTQRVTLWPFGANHFPELNLSPTNALITSPRGQRVDQSDVGTLYKHVQSLAETGLTALIGTEDIQGHQAIHFSVTGGEGISVGEVHSYELWIDTVTQFPLRIISRDRQNIIIETVTMKDLEIHATLPHTLFERE